MDIIQTVQLKKYYQTSSGEVRALDGVNLGIAEGENLLRADHNRYHADGRHFFI